MNCETTKPAADAVATQGQRAKLEMRIRKIAEEAPVTSTYGDAEILTLHSIRGSMNVKRRTGHEEQRRSHLRRHA